MRSIQSRPTWQTSYRSLSACTVEETSIPKVFERYGVEQQLIPLLLGHGNLLWREADFEARGTAFHIGRLAADGLCAVDTKVTH